MNFNPYHFQMWAVATVILFLKMLANTAVQGKARRLGAPLATPEDAKVFPALVSKAMAGKDLLDRASACWRNDMENIPMFLLLSLGYVLVGARSDVLLTCLAVFIFARVVHTIAYVGKFQPYRTLAFLLGLVASLVMAAAVCWRVVTIGMIS